MEALLMVVPLLLGAIGASGFATSAGANLYKQHVQRRLYDQFGKGYYGLYKGYENYLRRHGRSINPNRALTSYYGQYLRSKTNRDISVADSFGTLGGSVGAGAMLTRRWF